MSDFNEYQWLTDNGNLSFQSDQGVCVRMYWSAPDGRYFSTSCNGTIQGARRIIEQFKDHMFEVINKLYESP